MGSLPAILKKSWLVLLMRGTPFIIASVMRPLPGLLNLLKSTEIRLPHSDKIFMLTILVEMTYGRLRKDVTLTPPMAPMAGVPLSFRPYLLNFGTT
eukprot:8343050-Karenia_brevis.AAC.1